MWSMYISKDYIERPFAINYLATPQYWFSLLAELRPIDIDIKMPAVLSIFISVVPIISRAI